jgi:hypothetical protein
MNQAIVKANDITSKGNAKGVRDLKSAGEDVNELKKLFTGEDGSLLFVRTGDYVVWRGITLRTDKDTKKDEKGPGLYASGWTNAIKAYAAEELGEHDNPNIVRKSCDGSTLWSVDWLQTHFSAIRKKAAADNEKPRVFF